MASQKDPSGSISVCNSCESRHNHYNYKIPPSDLSLIVRDKPLSVNCHHSTDFDGRHIRPMVAVEWS